MPLLFESERMDSMPKKIDPQLRARCVRLVREHAQEYPTLTAATAAVARQEGVSRESVRRWLAQAEVDDGSFEGIGCMTVQAACYDLDHIGPREVAVMVKEDRGSKWRRLLIAYTAAFLVAFTGTVAIAGSSFSPTKNFGSGNYYNQSLIVTGSSDYANTASYSSGGSVPAGWLGAQTRAYVAASDVLKCGSTWGYSSTSTTGYGRSCYFTSGSNSYYAQGTTRGWNNSTGSYRSATTYKTPNQLG